LLVLHLHQRALILLELLLLFGQLAVDAPPLLGQLFELLREASHLRIR
jgi:hypothetical protein